MSTFVLDLDNTLCLTPGREYEHAKPIPNRIAKVNALYRQGHRIVIDTARGSATGIDWRPLTETQLRIWGVQYHDLRTGVKAPGDVYLDDKAVSLSEFFHD